ncbi:MAG: hypothetical protein CM1200mP35_03230 [Chloroflexota bacterium]|nr:MAG: hypothetical protein CM1200mP35_03230 [Chloroflexota bacterium]
MTRTAQEWENLIAEAGSEGAVCRTSANGLTILMPGIRMVVEVEDQVLGKMLQPGINARMSLTPGKSTGSRSDPGSA